MKLLVKIIIGIWILFLSLPTVVCIVADDADITISFSMTEEENENQVKLFEENFKDIHLLISESFNFYNVLKSSKINDLAQINLPSVYKKTFSPPPELV